MKRTLSTRRARCSRAGYTMLELVVNLGSASVLLAGLASTVYISTSAFTDVQEARTRAWAAEVHSGMMADLQCATSFILADDRAVTFTVPDRNGDGSEETISYTRSSSPDTKLLYSYNGGASSVLLDNIRQLRFTYLTRTIPAPAYTPPPQIPEQWGMRWLQQ